MARPTVNDIARVAGVSLATVDRVLNERPGVRDVTITRVTEAIRELGYVRDQSAANLARQRHYRLAFFLPDGRSQFLAALRSAIDARAADARVERTEFRIETHPAADPLVLVRQLDALDPKSIDGIAITAPETPHVRDAIKRLVDAGVAVVALVADLPNTEREHFVGIDNIAAGRTAGQLLGRFVGPGSGKLLVLAASTQARDSIERRLGFDQIISESFPELVAMPSLEGHENPETTKRILGVALDANPDVRGIYSLAASHRAVTAVLKSRAIARDVTVVAHELTPHAREALADGSFDAVITQDLGHVVRSAFRVLRAKSDQLVIDVAQERIRIDIVLRENMPAEEDELSQVEVNSEQPVAKQA